MSGTYKPGLKRIQLPNTKTGSGLPNVAKPVDNPAEISESDHAIILNLDPCEFKLFCFFVHLAREKAESGEIRITLGTLTKETAIPTTSLMRALTKLRQRELVILKEQDYQKGNLYFVDLSAWTMRV